MGIILRCECTHRFPPHPRGPSQTPWRHSKQAELGAHGGQGWKMDSKAPPPPHPLNPIFFPPTVFRVNVFGAVNCALVAVVLWHLLPAAGHFPSFCSLNTHGPTHPFWGAQWRIARVLRKRFAAVGGHLIPRVQKKLKGRCKAESETALTANSLAVGSHSAHMLILRKVSVLSGNVMMQRLWLENQKSFYWETRR